MLIKRLFI